MYLSMILPLNFPSLRPNKLVIDQKEKKMPMNARELIEDLEQEAGEKIDTFVLKGNEDLLERESALKFFEVDLEDVPTFTAWSQSRVYFCTDAVGGDGGISWVPRHPTAGEPQFYGLGYTI
jgi:hypothetical protein